MASAGPQKSFAEATEVKQLSSHSYEATFWDDWCIGTVPHGGYVTSVFLRVASTHFSSTHSSQNQPHTIALHLDFLRRTQAGPALFTVRDMKIGSRTSVIHVSLTQDDREEVVGYLTNSNMAAESGVSYSTNWTLNPSPFPVNLALLAEGKDANWTRFEIPFASFRKATGKTEFNVPRHAHNPRGTSDEWIRLRTGEKWTNSALGYVSDMWVTPLEAFLRENKTSDVKAVENAASGQPPIAKFWYPTVLLNLDIKKALPEEGVEWLYVRASIKQVKNGRMDLEIVIMDEGGEIVALSHHIALAVGAERNISKRTTNKSKI